MKQLIIPIHSYADLITNSSSEVFIAATDKTINTIKSIVDNLLSINRNGQTVYPTFDDLFTIDIVYEVDDEGDDVFRTMIKQAGGVKSKNEWDTYTLTKDQVKKLGELVDEKDKEQPDFSDELSFNVDSVFTGRDRYPENKLSVRVKDNLREPDKVLAEKTAKLLEGFIGTYEIESLMEG